jgi:sporulation protein YlmC with PRC-barrel domain
MKSLLVSLIVGAFVMMPGLAEAADRADRMDRDNKFLHSSEKSDFLASNLMGKTVYTTPRDTVAGSPDQRDRAATPGTQVDRPRTTVTQRPDDWENVGDIDDFVVTPDGKVRAVLLDVGGFLGIGARTVAVNMEALDFVYSHDDDDFYLVLTGTTKEQLENAPEYRHHEGTALGTAPGPGYRTTPAEGYTAVEPRAVTVEELKGANVYDANQENVASIDEVLVSPEGNIERVLLDVGGWLGMGARTVAVDMDKLEVHRGRDGDVRVYVNMTEEELRQLPEYTN